MAKLAFVENSGGGLNLDGLGGLGGKAFARLRAAAGDPLALRPYTGDDGNSYVTVMNHNTGEFEAKRIQNDPTTLPYKAWELVDREVDRVMRLQPRFVDDLVQSSLTKNIGNGLAHPVLRYSTKTNHGRAELAMDPVRRGPFSRPTMDIKFLPLPVIFEDFQWSWREMLIADAAGLQLDTDALENAAANCIELAEKMHLGVSDFDLYAYGGGTIYGITDEPNRNTKVLTDPTSATWNPQILLAEVLAMKEQLRADKKTGPLRLYASPGWDPYLDDDFSQAKGQNTLRQRLGQIDQIDPEVRTLEYLSGMKLMLIHWSKQTVQTVVGMDWTVVEWEEQGGQERNMKLMGMYVPLIKSDPDGNSGIVEGSVP